MFFVEGKRESSNKRMEASEWSECPKWMNRMDPREEEAEAKGFKTDFDEVRNLERNLKKKRFASQFRSVIEHSDRNHETRMLFDIMYYIWFLYDIYRLDAL